MTITTGKQSHFVQLGGVSEVVDRKVDPQQHAGQMYAHYSIPAFDAGEGPTFELGREIRSAKCEVIDDCVLFSKLNPRIPRVWHIHDHVDIPRICSTEFLVLQPKPDRIIATYLTWILQSPMFLQAVRSRVQAATKSRERVPEDVVVSTPIPVPSLDEQQRIVAKLDEQMAAVDRAEKALAEAQAAASAFTTVALQQVFSGSESGRWPQVRLGEVAASDLTQVPPDDEFAKDLPYIGMEDIESQTGRIIAQSAHSDVRSNTFAFDERHVLYGKLRPYLNKVALPESRGRCSTELIPLRPEARLDRRYLAWFLRRPETVSAAMQEKTGSRMPRASMKNIGQLHIPLPPLSHQRQVVASLERISAELTSLQQHFADQRTDLAVLRSSLLDAAFSGEI